jgi:aspartate kinase
MEITSDSTRPIESINMNTHFVKVTLSGVIDRHGVAAELFCALGQQGVNVEMITQSSAGRGRADISFAVIDNSLDSVCKVLDAIKGNFQTQEMVIDRNCALIMIYSKSMQTAGGLAGKIFARLAERQINIEMISSSFTSLNIMVKGNRAVDAVAAIRAEFGI